jgi:hypothetical protein
VEGGCTDAQQGKVTALVRHDDRTAAVMKASLEGVERKLRWDAPTPARPWGGRPLVSWVRVGIRSLFTKVAGEAV